MPITKSLEAWMRDGDHLPPPLRDFHDQKNLFKAMHEIVEERDDENIKRPTWVEGHCYVIDIFLWFMAKRGWTLQRTRRKGEYRNLQSDIETMNQLRAQKMSEVVGLTPLDDPRNAEELPNASHQGPAPAGPAA